MKNIVLIMLVMVQVIHLVGLLLVLKLEKMHLYLIWFNKVKIGI